MSHSTLFDGFQLGPISLANRAVMSPMTRCRAIGSVPNELMATYYGQRAGAGLIVTEGVAPSPNGLGYARIPGLFSDDQVEGWRLVTDSVHAAGGKIFAQLMHTGRVSHPANLPQGARVVAPSAVPLEETQMWIDEKMGMDPMPTAHALGADEVEETIGEFVKASENAIVAGFDGVELHGANGYLIEQFIHPHTNRRDDEWGGSVEARCRFAVEVARRVADAIGGERVGIRLSPYGTFNEMPLNDDIDASYRHLASSFGGLGLAYIHIVDHSSQGAPEVPDALKAAIRDEFGGAIILSGGYDHDRAAADLDAGKGHLVAFGVPFLANPDLLARFRTRAELNTPRTDLFYTPGADGYTDYPTLDG